MRWPLPVIGLCLHPGIWAHPSDTNLTEVSNESLGVATGAGLQTEGSSPAPTVLTDLGEGCQSCGTQSSRDGFEYHKEPFPLDWRHDGLTAILAALGLIVAASGGIGGGGILVPLFIVALDFKPKHAIALSNFTILGGAIANTVVNSRRRHPHRDGPLIDWDLILAMEPLTIFGAVFGSLLSKILPNFVLTVSLVVILAFIGHRTLKKGFKMFREESRSLQLDPAGTAVELSHRGVQPLDDNSEYVAFQSDSECGKGRSRLCYKIAALTVCFAGTCALTLLKGGGHLKSPFGVECGSAGYWILSFGAAPWVLIFAVAFRILLVREFEAKLQHGYAFGPGEVRWDSKNTITYPLLCAVAGLLAGLFGVGGGIVKGPLMLEMGILPSVASASAAAMILYTSAAASTSFIAFGLLHPIYGMLFFLLGLACTALGQYVVGQWVHKHNRQSPIVLSIGLVILLSAAFVAVDTTVDSAGQSFSELLAFHHVCDMSA